MADHRWLADVINPPPDIKAPGSDSPDGDKLNDAFNQLMSWAMWGTLALCTVAFILGVGMAAIGANSARPDMAERGKRAAMWALVGAALVGLSVFLVNTFYNIGTE